jgi:hypothetical protein
MGCNSENGNGPRVCAFPKIAPIQIQRLQNCRNISITNHKKETFDRREFNKRNCSCFISRCVQLLTDEGKVVLCIIKHHTKKRDGTDV